MLTADVLFALSSERKKLRECFNSLDEDGNGSIGVEELLEPMMGLGFVDNEKQIVKMIKEVG